MSLCKGPLVLAMATMMVVACEPERRGAPEDPGEADEGADEEPPDEGGDEGGGGLENDEGAAGAEGDEGEGVRQEGAQVEGQDEGGAEQAEGAEGEGEAAEGADEGADEGAAEGAPVVCRANSDCLIDAYCDRGSGECIVAAGCEPCDAQDFCAPAGGQPQRCDFRFAAAGCCVDSCSTDADCPQERYCDFGGPSCEEGCRVGSCGEGLICGLIDRVCREGCLDHAGCAGDGRICDLDNQVCTDGCVDPDGCAEGRRCDVGLQECTTGCIEDDDCAAGLRCQLDGHRCVEACERDGDCLEGQLCDDDFGGCVANRGGCLAAGCPDGAGVEDVCDPIRGICDPPAEEACEPAARCGDGAEEDPACVPEGAEDRYACVAPGGPGGAGAECETGADCVSGICLNEGGCYEACSGHEDCPEGQRCWGSRFLVQLSADLLDPSDDGVREAAACRSPPAPCARPADCEDEEQECLPWWDPDAETMATACRPAAGGPRAPGRRCRSHDDCSTGICTQDNICLQVCVVEDAQGGEEGEGEGEGEGDEGAAGGDALRACGDPQLCGSVSVDADGRQGDVPACALDPGSGLECQLDADCPQGEACRAEPGEAEDAVVLRCRPGVGLGPAQLCQNPWDCASGYCVDLNFCFGACLDDDDCPGDVRCQQQRSQVAGRQDVLVMMCDEPNLPCDRDSDCPVDAQACGPEADPENRAALAPRCRGVSGDRRGGEACDEGPECLSGYCIQELFEQVCWEGCIDDDDCGEEMVCYGDVAPVSLDGGDAFDSAPACLPNRGSLDDCDNNDDCGEGEVCSLVVSGDRQAINTRCVSQVANPDDDQGVCVNPEQCSSGLCAPGAFLPPCLRLCDVDADCPQGWGLGFLPVVCVTEDVGYQGVEDSVSYCSVAL